MKEIEGVTLLQNARATMESQVGAMAVLAVGYIANRDLSELGNLSLSLELSLKAIEEFRAYCRSATQGIAQGDCKAIPFRAVSPGKEGRS